MEGDSFSTIIKFFFQFGPFAILPYLMLFALPRLYKQMKTASKDIKIAVKRNIVIYQVLIVFLIIFCVGFWTFSSEETNYYIGEVVNLNPAEYQIESRHLYLRNYLVGNDYVVDWIWRKNKEDQYASIKLSGKDPITGAEVKKEFQLNPFELKKGEKCVLRYNKEDGVLMKNGVPLKIAFNFETGSHNPVKKPESTFGILYAQEPGASNIDKILENLQAYISDIRDYAVNSALTMAQTDRDAVYRLLKKGFEILLNGSNQDSKSPIKQNSRLYNPEYLLTGLLHIVTDLSGKWNMGYSEWKGILGEEAFNLIIEESTGNNAEIRNLAGRFLIRFKKDVANDLEAKSSQVQYKNDQRFLDRTRRFFKRFPELEAKVKPLDNNLNALADKSGASRNIKVPLLPKGTESSEKQIDSTSLKGKIKLVIDSALDMKNKNIPFKFGGKTLQQGMDSSGYIAYIFNKAGLLNNPGEWWSGKMREKLGTVKPANTPLETGDLIFFNDGYVMLYAGENMILGMTPGGIIITDIRKIPGKPIQVNRVDYGKFYSL